MTSKRMLRIALTVAGAYLAVSFVFTIAQIKPWRPDGHHSMIPGWFATLVFFPFWIPVGIKMQLGYGQTQEAIRLAVSYVLSILGLSLLALWRFGLLRRPAQDPSATSQRA